MNGFLPTAVLHFTGRKKRCTVIYIKNVPKIALKSKRKIFSDYPPFFHAGAAASGGKLRGKMLQVGSARLLLAVRMAALRFFIEDRRLKHYKRIKIFLAFWKNNRHNYSTVLRLL
ncbi:MAG: hypothetical protein ONA90_04475 [candidate division KSB1 bacterium]|nr:hypothetical protein [candidate division KSB1 bacterium]